MTSIDLHDLSKSYGRTRAVDGLTFSVLPGRVTGFLGPNGAGKSTTMRLVLGLDRPSSGSATVGGLPYAAYPHPMREVGALLDAGAAHGSRTARNHLRALAASNGIGMRRVDEVLEQAGIARVAGRRISTFSLGMRQRLGVAAALLGDPPVLMLDEPSNGLDPEGIIWIRELLRDLAGEGRAVLVSSHLMSETAVLADHLVVLGRGRLLADTPLREFVARGGPKVRLRTTDDTRLSTLLRARGITALRENDGRWVVEGMSLADVGALAADEALPLLELSDDAATLEEAYMDLTAQAADYVSTTLPTRLEA